MISIARLIFILIITVALAQACPTCIGRQEKLEVAFFKDEFYQAHDAEQYDSGEEQRTQEMEANDE